MRSPSYAVFCLVVVALLSPAPATRVAYWPRSADFWAIATAANVTIDDTSSLITYSANDTWRPSTVPCDTCLDPDNSLAYAGTWHDGTHIIPTVDNDDVDDTDQQSGKSGNGGGKQGGDGDQDGDGGGDGDSGDNGKGGKDGQHRRGMQDVGVPRFKRQESIVSNPFFTPNLDSDDPGFVDKSVTVEFNFTGSAIYVFAIMPLFAAPANTTPTFMNLTYTFDSQPAGVFLHSGSATAPNTSYSPSVVVFQKTGLPESPHSLTVSVGPDSVFLLDYIVYTQDSDFEPAANNTSGGSSSSAPVSSPVGVVNASPSPTISQATASASSSASKSHNVSTFAGAVGGSVGLLTFLSFALAFSLCRRRRLARRRDRAYRESRRETSSISTFHTDASEDGPPMQGPVPFVPRYFPGTVIHAAPPPYTPSASPSNEPTSALLGTPETPTPSMMWSSRRTGGVVGDSESYAERPPPTPPPAGGSLMGTDVEEGYFAPPPSFQVAIATPVPAILAGLSGVSSPAAGSPSPPSPPASPVIPLLPPPPSSRPPQLISTSAPSSSSEQGLSVLLSSTQAPLFVRPTASSQSLRSLHPQSSDGAALDPDGDTHSITRSSSESNRGEATVPGRASLQPAITESQGSLGVQAREGRGEEGRDSTHR
ncbi:uncharacterized protein PHACADRAFT_261484 [Phanerochaete carnosa HHB-10118-sp]|uniref:Uncharacterized protein n=1 Tax=Phanerochaete carnosa (strain HHB-10118-sp) TaxID=650164 RepID=K5USG8_PHACS|nr:uncharacterized protein PHACADRAFT_261484 [Phanerochaete carnosa HHB-10118-sp]EKM52831.1 hypothetical protein PHACADRAFT_261484 [Phanerochaete carnosa HHB-10118-sp]